MSCAPFTMPDMAKAHDPDSDKREIVTVRLPRSLLAALKAIGARSMYPPTLTQQVESAVREHVERHSPDSTRAAAKGKR
jgi:hypothetical protein